jgi:hypothetical protein
MINFGAAKAGLRPLGEAFMSDTRYSEGEFRVGDVLSRTFTVLSRNLLPFGVVAGIAYLPTLALMAERGGRPTPGRAFLLLGLSMLLSMVLNALSQATILFGAFEDMRGRPVNLMASVQVGLSRFFPVLGTAFLAAILAGLAALLFVIPAFIVVTMLFVATPACVVERLGPTRSLGRSSELTKGHRWKIFGLLFLVGIIMAIGTGAAGLLVYLGGNGLALLVKLLWGAVSGAFYVIMVVVTYHDLRVVKEGVDTDKIASVFD